MADEDAVPIQYRSNLAYLKAQARIGSLTNDNSIWKQMEGCRGVRSVNDYMSLHVDGHVKKV